MPNKVPAMLITETKPRIKLTVKNMSVITTSPASTEKLTGISRRISGGLAGYSSPAELVTYRWQSENAQMYLTALATILVSHFFRPRSGAHDLT
jgi:hypothetical protein